MKQVIVLAIVFLTYFVRGQEPAGTTQKIWTLEECISYALENNITVKQAELQKNSSEVNYMAEKSSRLPNLTGNASQNFTNGNSIDPITSDFVSQQINATSLGLNTQITLFQGNQINNQIQQSKLLVDQYGFYEEEAMNDITLRITESYIQLLYGKETISER